MTLKNATQLPTLRDLVLGNPVARGSAVVGDSSTQLILREAFHGVRRFSDWWENLRLPRTVLAARLQHLVAAGLMRQCPAASGRRQEYRLTEMGLDLFGTALLMGQWERRHAPSPLQERYAITFYDRGTDQVIRPGVLSRPAGFPIDPRRVTYVAGPGLVSQPAPPYRRRRATHGSTNRPMIERSVEIIGDYWSWAVVSAAYFRARRFDDFAEATGMASNVLSDRLSRMVDAGILKRTPYGDVQTRFEYHLDEAGLDLYPAVLALFGWSEKWLCDPENPPLKLFDRFNGERITPVVCDLETGRPIDARRTRWVLEAEAPPQRKAKRSR